MNTPKNTQNIEAIYPLSPMQEGMLFHTLYAPESAAYFEQLDFTIEGPLDISALKQAWQDTLARHPILRTLFVWQQRKKPLQVVRQHVPLPWADYDWRDLPAAAQQERLDAFLQADRAAGFDLNKAPLMRLALIRLDADKYQFVWGFHHLLLDGWSTPLLLKEVFAQYQALARGAQANLIERPPYKRYIEWLQQQDLGQAKQFWQQTLRGFAAPTPLRVDQIVIPPAEPAQDYAETQVKLPADTTANLQRLARQHQVTLNTLLQATWGLLLSHYSGEKDVVFGATVSGRPPELPQIEQMIGLFINTLPVRMQISSQVEIDNWLHEIQRRQAKARRYEYSPLAQVQKWSDVSPGQPLFETIFVFENYPTPHSAWAQDISDMSVRNIRFFEQTNYPLTLSVAPDAELLLHLSFDTARLDPPTAERMLAHLQTLLESMLARPQARLSQLSMLTQAERQQLIVEWNRTAAEFPTDSCIHHLFETQAAQTPQAVAVVFPRTDPTPAQPGQVEQISYRALNRRANQLAHHLQTLGVGPETPVGLCLNRSIDMLVGVLGILKAGGAYLPLDPGQPAERLEYMLRDAQVSTLVTRSQFLDALPAEGLQTVCLDTGASMLSQQPAHNPTSPVTPQNLAYIIYTSGSTGRPKGVMVNHASLVNAYFAWESAYDLRGAVDCHLQMARFTFDVFTGDWARALCSGGKLALCPWDYLLDPPKLYGYMRQERVTCAEFVPAVMRSLLDYLTEIEQNLDFMRLLIVASDSWYVEEYRQILQFCGPNTRLLNSYGLTEATIDSSYFEGDLSDWPGNRPTPIGRPFANTQLYILNDALQPVPIGVPGQLYIGGAGLARGYLNRPNSTAERFIPNPFYNDERGTMNDEHSFDSAFRIPHSSLYKTGDVARYLPDGNIEFLGRVDYQVKIRGFRVELGEIEAALSQHTAVKAAAVLEYQPPGSAREKQLAAYVVPSGAAHEELVRELRQFLQSKLPDYMIPSAMMLLDEVPLTPSGKIDRRRLPAPEATPLNQKEYVAPSNNLETTLAQIWGQVLGLEQVSVNDNFFELGGHSLLALQLVAQIRKTTPLNIELCWLFDAPTVAQLAKILIERNDFSEAVV